MVKKGLTTIGLISLCPYSGYNDKVNQIIRIMQKIIHARKSFFDSSFLLNDFNFSAGRQWRRTYACRTLQPASCMTAPCIQPRKPPFWSLRYG